MRRLQEQRVRQERTSLATAVQRALTLVYTDIEITCSSVTFVFDIVGECFLKQTACVAQAVGSFSVCLATTTRAPAPRAVRSARPEASAATRQARRSCAPPGRRATPAPPPAQPAPAAKSACREEAR